MDETVKLYLDMAEESMTNSIHFLDEALAHIRAGKANVRILDGVRVDYYGAMSPLSSVATVTTPDAKTILIQPWEKSMLSVKSRAASIACRLFPLMGGGSCGASGFCGFREKDLANRPESGYNSATIAKEVML